jgi:hypothetical protein
VPVSGSSDGRKLEARVSDLGWPSTHKSTEVAEKIRNYNGRLCVYQLPGYSPELNPGEGVWGEVKSHRMGRTGVFTFVDMKSKALGALRHLAHRPDKIRSLFRKPSTLYAA